MNLSDPPAFAVYALTAAFVSTHMVLLDAWGGAVRAKTKTAINVEDTSTVSKGAQLVEADPPEVARVMRAHRNLVANGLPFLLVGLVWTLLGADRTQAMALFGTFVGARLIHTFAYLGAKQPFRTLSFVIGQLALLGVIIQVVRAAIAGL
jgi:prostaglandin-E synthase 1